MSELIGIDGDAGRAHVVTEAAQDLGVDPSGFAAAEGVEGIEPDLHPLAEPDGFDVVDGDTVLQGQSGNVGAQRETAVGREVPEINFDSASAFVRTEIRSNYRVRIAKRGAVKFAVADQHYLTDQIDDLFAPLARKLREFGRTLCQFAG